MAENWNAQEMPFNAEQFCLMAERLSGKKVETKGGAHRGLCPQGRLQTRPRMTRSNCASAASKRTETAKACGKVRHQQVP